MLRIIDNHASYFAFRGDVDRTTCQTAIVRYGFVKGLHCLPGFSIYEKRLGVPRYSGTGFDQDTSSSETLIPQVDGTHLGYSDPDYASRDWGSYLERFFKPIARMTRYNYFRFDWRQPGWVELRVDPKDEPERQFILRRSRYRFPKPVKYPAVIEPDGLGPERQQYLYTKIRPLVRNPKKRDLTCPRPD